MNRFILTAVMAAGMVGLSAAPAAARTYDCSKAGNANKAECKSAAKAAAKPAKAATAAKPAPAKATATKAAPAATTKTSAKTERNYDCRLKGNKNKAACKTAAATPAAKPMAPAASPMVAAVKRMVAAKPAPRPAPKAAAASSDDKNPAGSIGRCKDGFYSHAKQRTGACSRHGGVAKWS